ncbi:fimbria/pilus outer membrane usher protein [Lysobacter sp. FW306-1B-D06B]|uniref:fimbria/pilus outer membrane usher protein n=1 Tax=Lysobacter sp. FW306-1B-D06B TaxID=3140250 RepID=UPI0031402090
MSRNKTQPAFNLRPIALSIAMVLGAMPTFAIAAPDPNPSPDPSPRPAPQVEFNVIALGAVGAQYDLSRFERGNTMLPGEQRVDLRVNQVPFARQNITFRANDEGNVAPCFTRELLTMMGVDTGKLEAAGANLNSDCLDISALIPDATWTTDANELRMDVSIPQIAMHRDAAGYVDPKLWDRGINAFTLGYSANASQSRTEDGATYTGGYVGLNAGLNVGGWRIRNQSGYRWNDSGDREFQNIRTYAEHDIDRLTATLTVGDTFTSGVIFDTTAFRGLSLATDDRMRPDSVNGYAPIVRGTADTNAIVEIRQSGYVVYQTTVAPGAFEITDLGATGFGGDLEVTVIEADGRKHAFTVPFAAMPQLLRPGVSRFAVTAGQLRQSNLFDTPRFAEGTYQLGINNWLTGYAGAQVAGDNLYRSLAVGGAFNTPVGAMALDVTGSRTQFGAQGGDLSGYSARVTYSKNVPSTSTTFALAAYRYSSSGFLTLNDAVMANDDLLTGRRERIYDGEGTARSRLQLTVNQHLGANAGDLYVVGSRNDYWNELPVDNTYQIGWNKRFRNVSLGVNASRSRVANGQTDDRYFVNFIMPLGSPSERRMPPTLSLNATHGGDGNRMRAGVSGVAGENRQVSYGVSGDFGDNNDDSIGTNVNWQLPYATVGGAYTYGKDSQSASVSAQGALLVHRGGITLASQLGETIGLVNAPGAKGARLSGGVNKVDGRGYGVVSNMRPYRLNDLVIDPKGVSADVEFPETSIKVVPRAGAVVPVTFETKTGAAYLLHALRDDGSPLPFGAEVTDDAGDVVGYVGQSSQAFVRLPDGTGKALSVQLDASGRKCSLEWTPDGGAKAGEIRHGEGKCRAL